MQLQKVLKVIFDIEILIINQDVYLKKGGDTFANSSYLMISETHVTISYIYWHYVSCISAQALMLWSDYDTNDKHKGNIGRKYKFSF